MTVAKEAAVVFRGGGRRWLTERAAVRAEAVALIKSKHPSEPPEPEVSYAGWHWSMLPRSDVLLRRVTRLVRASMKEPA